MNVTHIAHLRICYVGQTRHLILERRTSYSQYNISIIFCELLYFLEKKLYSTTSLTWWYLYATRELGLITHRD